MWGGCFPGPLTVKLLYLLAPLSLLSLGKHTIVISRAFAMSPMNASESEVHC